MFTPIACLALLCSTASAADVEVTVDRVSRVLVDGKRVKRAVGARGPVAEGLEDGSHQVEIANVLGKVVASISVEAVGDERVHVVYRHGVLTEVGRGPSLAVERAALSMTLAAAEAAEAAAAAAEAEARAAAADARAAQAQASAAEAGARAIELQALLYGPGFSDVEVGATARQRALDAPPITGMSAGTGGNALASVSFNGLDPDLFAVYLDERPVSWVAHLGAFVATDLPPTTASLVLRLEGQDALRADFTTKAGVHSACTVLVRPDTYDTGCVSGGRPLTALDLHDPLAEAEDPPSLPPTIAETVLQALVDTLVLTPYVTDQQDLVEGAADKHRFSCAQVVRLIEPLPYYENKLRALRSLRPSIVDPRQYFLIEGAFPYTEHRDAVRGLFAGDARPAQGLAPADQDGPGGLR